ncbi:hypothetical protein [Eubacterium sp. AB3007]|uniref:hypothetical protein n=1 Tax=Eubacterium sp. AB3007 TaxID=1392487 RepID=UPI00048507CF|nr:hypothetical protein [Eubacterium sp. AB3007]
MGTKKPTGLSIARSGGTLTLSWKAGDKYNKGQEFESKTSQQKSWGGTVKLGDDVRKRNYGLGLSSYYPATSKYLTSVGLRVRGKKKKTWSAWADKTYSIAKPNAPSVSAAPDGTNVNVCVFSWSVATSDSDNKIYVNAEYQTMLVADCSVTDGSKLSWKSSSKRWATGTINASSYSHTITEDTSDIATGSHTRWFRVRARGPAGASDWRYAKRVYAAPNQAVITSASATKNSAGGFQIYVAWSNASNAANPTDSMVVQYAKAVPDPGMVCPGSASWTDIATSVRYDSTNAISASVDGTLEEDHCIFVRINTVHLDKTVYGVPVSAMIGNLKAPEIENVESDNATHRATITVSHQSEVADSFVVVLYRASSNPGQAAVVGIIPHGSTSTTVQCPDWSNEESYSFGIYAAVGSYEEVERTDQVSSYTVTAKMRSLGEVWSGGTVPKAPANVTATSTSIPGTIRVSWDWSWKEATLAVLSWADHEDAWESTNEPEEYTVGNVHASEWNISDLETGVRWYIRVRLGIGSGDNVTYGPWSAPVVIDLSSAPAIPSLMLSAGVIPADGSITAYWSYVTTDGTGQAYAEICEAAIDGEGITYGDIVASTQTAQHITISAEEAGWEHGETHLLCVRVVSGSGKVSDSWSDPVPIIIAEPLTCEIVSTSLVSQTITVDGEDRSVLSLRSMPLQVEARGAGTGGTTTVWIERAEDYHVDRPDETEYTGYEGESIVLISRYGEAPVYIAKEDLIGALDDGARYRVVATVQDGLGQSASDSIEFEVHWQHQAVMPEASVTYEDDAALITLVEPEGTGAGDTCDIYRLSSDKPELIVQGAAFGTTYVDPYPAIGEFGGHRVVFRTADGDYITDENDLAFLDLGIEDGDTLHLPYGIIDYDGEQIEILYDVTQSNTWEKDFKETAYLGGAVQGDWNKSVSMKSSISLSAVTVRDQMMLKAMRRLAAYPGICHIRTLDGASFSCDIQVSENRSYGQNKHKAEFTLSVTRVDPEELDGQTYEAWRE